MKFTAKKYIGIAFLCTLMACANPEKKATEGADSTVTTSDAKPAAEVKLTDPEVSAIYAAYIDLKDRENCNFTSWLTAR